MDKAVRPWKENISSPMSSSGYKKSLNMKINVRAKGEGRINNTSEVWHQITKKIKVGADSDEVLTEHKGWDVPWTIG